MRCQAIAILLACSAPANAGGASSNTPQGDAKRERELIQKELERLGIKDDQSFRDTSKTARELWLIRIELQRMNDPVKGGMQRIGGSSPDPRTKTAKRGLTLHKLEPTNKH